LVLVGCGGTGPSEAAWPPVAKKWFDRAGASFRSGDVEDAEYAVGNALRVAGQRTEVRLLAAKIALAQLEYDRVLQLLEGVTTSEARGVRGRALWYSGQVERTADELELLINDPEVRDMWAVDVAKLARRGGGRKPFQVSGGLLAVTEMPRAGTAALLVPLEVNGEQALGLIATGTAEAVIDSSAGNDASWISLRFGERVEVRDVPALARDLSGISRQVNAPVKVLLGVNVLRHLHPTFDFAGSQFVVRTFEPPPPPHATTVKLNYVRGGGMLMRGAFGREQSAPQASLLIDTAQSFPLALDDGGWKKAGVNLNTLNRVPNATNLRYGLLPMLRLGAFELPEVESVHGAPVEERERKLEMDLDGVVGAGLLAFFRVTLVDGGRTMWLEPMPYEQPLPAEPGNAKPAPAEKPESKSPEPKGG
jgi:hypothetical protein